MGSSECEEDGLCKTHIYLYQVYVFQEQEMLLNELRSAGFFDVFELNTAGSGEIPANPSLQVSYNFLQNCYEKRLLETFNEIKMKKKSLKSQKLLLKSKCTNMQS